MSIDLKNISIQKAHDAMVRGDFSARELSEAYLKNIEAKNKELNVYLEVFDDVLAQAEEADRRFRSGEHDNLLLGIPFAIKDNILIRNRRAGSASKILENYIAPYDATAISKLKEKGVVFLGRVNMDEFAMGGSTENSAYDVTKNPIDMSRVSGGSSGGSAASVAGEMALVALGSDTGGSIRQPASFCGIVGFKPSYGAVSRHGLMAMSSSLDQIGPLTRNTKDAEIVFKEIVGVDSLDATTKEIKKDTNNKKTLGIMSALLDTEGIDGEVKQNFFDTVEKFKAKGYTVKEVDLPHISYSLPVYYIICPAEVSSNMARFDGVRFGSKVEGSNLLEDYIKTRGHLLGKEVKRRIMIGTYVLSSGYYESFYGKGVMVRNLIKQDFEKVFESGVDAILTPTTPAPAFKIGEKTANPLEMYLADIFTVTANLAGIPALSIPSGATTTNLPLGIQLMGAFGNDLSLLEIAKDFQE